MKKGTIALLLVAAAVGGFIGIYWASMASESTSYATFPTAKETQEEVHIVGSWIRRDESYYDAENDLFHFWMQDTTNNVSQVIYNDPKPNDFETAERVVVMGKYHGEDEIFYATSILMKCPSKYNEEGGEFTADGMREENDNF